MSEIETAQFKDHLFATFKQTGLINKLKSTLRKNLLDKLQIQAPPQPKQPSTDKLPLILTKKVITAIISEYLLKNNQQYTVSILLPETNMNRSQLLNHSQIFKLLGIQQWQYEGIQKVKYNYSVLDALVYMCSCEFKKSMEDECVGTRDDFEEPISRKLEILEKGYLSQMQQERLGRVEGLEEILEKQRRSITEMMNSRFEVEKRMLTNQIEGKVRREESDRWSGLALMSKKQQDNQYEKKLLDLKSRQKDVLERLEKRRKQVQGQINKLRSKEFQMIKKYQMKQKQLDIEFKHRVKDIEIKQKQLNKQQMQIRAKKKEYQDCIRMVRQKIIQQN